MAIKNSRVGALVSDKNSTRDDEQAASIGATIGPDGWWYKDGKRLSHKEADDLTKAKGTAASGLQEWGLGKGTFGDITGGRIGDVHIPPAIAEGLRAAAAVGGSFIGIPPQITYALANNLGKGPASVSSVLKNTAAGVVKGAAVGGAMSGWQGARAAGSGIPGGIGGAAKGALAGAMNPLKGAPQGVQDLAGKIPSLAGGIGGAVSALGGGGGSGGGWGDIGLGALGVAQGVNAAALGQKSNNFADMAAKNVDELWKQKAPLRVAGIAGMLNPKTEDTSALQRISARGNPFADRPQPMGGY